MMPGAIIFFIVHISLALSLFGAGVMSLLVFITNSLMCIIIHGEHVSIPFQVEQPEMNKNKRKFSQMMAEPCIEFL